MEEKHIPTEHVTDHMTRPREVPIPTAAEAMMIKLREAAEREEMFALNSQADEQQQHRFRGICANLGNAVFSDTPTEPPSYRTPIVTHGLVGYQRPIQNPMYTTSAADLGQQPTLATVPEKFYPKESSFTRQRDQGGNYRDTHFTTEIEKSCLE